MEKKLRFSYSSALIVLVMLLVSSCQPAKPDLAQIRTEIQALEDSFANGINAKDADAVISYYATDAVSLESDAPAVKGQAAILEMIKRNIASDTLNLVVSFEIVDLFAAGDLVTEIGKAIYKDSSGNIVKTGKYVSLFEKRNGKYVCIRDIYSNDSKE